MSNARTVTKLRNVCLLALLGSISLGTSCEEAPPDDLSMEVHGKRISFVDIKLQFKAHVTEWTGTRRTDSTIETLTGTMPADAQDRFVFSPLVDSLVHLSYVIMGKDTVRYETRLDERHFTMTKWTGLSDPQSFFASSWDGVMLNSANALDTLEVKRGYLYIEH